MSYFIIILHRPSVEAHKNEIKDWNKSTYVYDVIKTVYFTK